MNIKNKIVLAFGLSIGLILLVVLMNLVDRSMSLTNKAVGSGEVGMKFIGKTQVAKSETFKETLQVYSKSGSKSFAGVQAYISNDPRFTINAIRCLPPFTNMSWNSVMATSVVGKQSVKVMCVANTPRIINTTGMPYAEVDMTAGIIDGEGLLVYMNNGVALPGTGTETSDISAAGESLLIKVGSGVNPPTPTTNPNGADLRADEMMSWVSGVSSAYCRTFSIPVTNVGKTAIGNFALRLYIDPADKPPKTATLTPYDFIYSGSLGPNQVQAFEKEICGLDPKVAHVIYSWADPMNEIREPNENNNLVMLTISIQPTPTSVPTVTPKPTGGACVAENGSCTINPDNCCGTLNCKSFYANGLDPHCLRCEGTCQIGATCPAGYTAATGSCGYGTSCCQPATATPTPGNGQIGGWVFIDSNSNGVRDANEKEGVGSVTITAKKGTVTATGRSIAGSGVNDRGWYQIFDLSAGTYRITVTVPAGYVSTSSAAVDKAVAAGNETVVSFGVKLAAVSLTPTPTPVLTNCPRGTEGNLNCGANGKINFLDLTIMVSPNSWRVTPLPSTPAGQHTPDISPAGGNGFVDVSDLARLLNNWDRD